MYECLEKTPLGWYLSCHKRGWTRRFLGSVVGFIGDNHEVAIKCRDEKGDLLEQIIVPKRITVVGIGRDGFPQFPQLFHFVTEDGILHDENLHPLTGFDAASVASA